HLDGRGVSLVGRGEGDGDDVVAGAQGQADGQGGGAAQDVEVVPLVGGAHGEGDVACFGASEVWGGRGDQHNPVPRRRREGPAKDAVAAVSGRYVGGELGRQAGRPGVGAFEERQAALRAVAGAVAKILSGLADRVAALGGAAVHRAVGR